MRAGPLSNTNIIGLLNAYFVPVYVVNEDYSRNGTAPKEEKAELQALFKAGHEAKKSVGSVHVYILKPDGGFLDSLHVAEAAKTKILETTLQKAVHDLSLQPGPPLIKPQPQSAAPACDSDSLLLHLVSRSVDGRGAWTEFPVENWITLSADEQKALLPSAATASWTPDLVVMKKLFQYFYPATENNSVEKNRFRDCSVKGTLVPGKQNQAELEAAFTMDHSFYHREDGKTVTATVLGFLNFDPATKRVTHLQMTTRTADYNGGKFAVAVQSAPVVASR
jgi:hypothetical protein